MIVARFSAFLSLAFSLTAATFGALTLAVFPARAIQGGVESSEPDGLRRFVVGIIGPRGKCTGTVIARRMAITAAHCLREPGDYAIRLLDSEGHSHDIAVEQPIVHPGYATPQRDGRFLGAPPRNDMALLITAEDFPEWVQPVGLSERPFIGKHPLPFRVAGFGPAGSSEAERIFGTLRELPFRKMHEGPAANLTLNLEEGGACIGDSGGPVLRVDASSVTLVAVMSSVSGPKGLVCGNRLLAAPFAASRSFIEGEAAKAGQTVLFE